MAQPEVREGNMTRQRLHWPPRLCLWLALLTAGPTAGAATLEDALAGALERAGPLDDTALPAASSWLSIGDHPVHSAG